MAQRKTTSRSTRKPRSRQPVTPTMVATTNGNLRLVEPTKTKTRRASKKPKVAVLLDTDDIVREQVGGFTNFLREYAVVGLAVGFIVGQQANTVVKQLVASFVDPFAKVWFGQSISSRSAVLHHGTEKVYVPWGAFVFTLLDFFLVLIFIYAVIKVFKLDRLKKVDDKTK